MLEKKEEEWTELRSIYLMWSIFCSFVLYAYSFYITVIIIRSEHKQVRKNASNHSVSDFYYYYQVYLFHHSCIIVITEVNWTQMDCLLTESEWEEAEGDGGTEKDGRGGWRSQGRIWGD